MHGDKKRKKYIIMMILSIEIFNTTEINIGYIR